jgi:hypothetical protein
MEYRGFQYNVVQGMGRHMWKWSTGQAHTRTAAVTAAEKAIDRALAIKKVQRMLRSD